MPLTRWIYTWRLRLRSIVRRDIVDRELDDELRFHLEQRIERHVADGMPALEARAAALRALGGLEQRKEACRDTRRVQVVDHLRRDLRHALRWLRRSPGFAAAAVLSLALGIGATTAIFSLINGLLLRTLPVSEPERLVVLSGDASPNRLWTYAIWDQVRQQSPVVAEACAWGTVPAGLLRFTIAGAGLDGGQPIDGMFASGNYFSLLGVPALLGRTFSAADDRRGGGPDGAVAVIGYAFWQRHFGGAATAIGSTLTVNQTPFTVIGVTPPGFFGTEVGRSFDIFLPIGTEPLIRGAGADSFVDHRTAFWLHVILRLAPGQSLEAATTALRTVQPRIREGAMPSRGNPRFLQPPLTLKPAAAGTSGLRQRYERPLLTIFVVAGLVLLIACANVANLLLARATARTHELTVRLALGASRLRLAQQLFVESLVLSIAGAGLGLVVALWASHALVGHLSTLDERVALAIPIDWRVLLFTMTVALITTLLFGTAPALRGTRARPIDALRAHGRATAGERRASVPLPALPRSARRTSPRANGTSLPSSRWFALEMSGAVVVAQVALSLVLVVAAGLFVRTFARIASVPHGFDAERVLVTRVYAGRSETDPARRPALYQQLADRVAALPGVAQAATSVTTPLSGSTWGAAGRIEVAGAPPLPEHEQRALGNFISPGWFATYGTRLIAGRDFDRRDTATALPVAIVNDAFVSKFFPGRPAIGGTITLFPGGGHRTIVGVVSDALYRSAREPPAPTMYAPMLQYDWVDTPLPSVSVSVRAASGPPMLLARSVASALAEIDGNLTLAFRPLMEQVHASVAQERLVAALSGAFGLVALLLAGVGLYGVTSYAVNRRRAELAIRLALGAAPGGVVRLVLLRLFLLVTAGIVAGGVISLWASRFVATLLYGLEPRDPATLAGAALVLAAVGAIAGWWPAWRASRIDPAHVLREG